MEYPNQYRYIDKQKADKHKYRIDNRHMDGHIDRQTDGPMTNRQMDIQSDIALLNRHLKCTF